MSIAAKYGRVPHILLALLSWPLVVVGASLARFRRSRTHVHCRNICPSRHEAPSHYNRMTNVLDLTNSSSTFLPPCFDPFYKYAHEIDYVVSLSHLIDPGKVTVQSEAGPGEKQPRTTDAVLPISATVIRTPPKNRRLLWDQFHSVPYPPSYSPRDYLGALPGFGVLFLVVFRHLVCLYCPRTVWYRRRSASSVGTTVGTHNRKRLQR